VALTDHYHAPEAWAQGADPAYEALSRAIVAATPVPLGGRLVADLGAGTGATSRAIAAAGGRPIALDLSTAMLGHLRSSRAPAVVADIAALPLATASAGAAVAAFSLSHVDAPHAALAEARRVTAAGGPVLAGVFAASGARHPASGVVDALATRRGWLPPEWYLHLKNDLEPRVADRDTLTGLATAAGLADVEVVDRDVDAGLDTPETLIRWRLGGPALAPFFQGLPAHEQRLLISEAAAQLGPDVEPLRLTVRILSSVVPAVR
jgi:SAM-dependent methyltransferase